jgi:HlyD family secretion protein
MRDGKPQMIPLRIGLSDGSLTEILEGDLREGEVVVVDASVADGQTEGAAPTGPGGMRRLF